MQGIAKTRHPGRFEKISKSPVIIRDGAHNPGAARALRDALSSDETLPKHKKIHLIMGVFKDKDYKEILRIMLPGSVSLTAFDLPDPVRGLPKEELIKAAKEVSENLPADCPGPDEDHIGAAGSLEEALEQTKTASSEDVYVVFGSLSLMQLFKDL
jgi:dihydrofolate synthase/folylpolyglutamate synthase